MRKKQVGQSILLDGPRWHIKKEGTPTMGGVSFVITFSIIYLIFVVKLLIFHEAKMIKYSLPLYIFSMLNAGIGLIDDMSKARKKENKGLSARAKFSLQSIAAIIYLCLLNFINGANTQITVPILNLTADLGVIYYTFSFIILCGFVNAVNLTDGIDGLAGSVTLTVGILFSVISLFFIKDLTLLFFSASLVGILLSFLFFNLHPAKIFMGDTGSLFLGALVVGFSFMINNQILIFLYGFVFLIEAISVILQVLVFKLFKGKRILKMAPLHHHFEKCGWSENKIVLLFSFVNLVFCCLSIFLVV